MVSKDSSKLAVIKKFAVPWKLKSNKTTKNKKTSAKLEADNLPTPDSQQRENLEWDLRGIESSKRSRNMDKVVHRRNVYTDADNELRLGTLKAQRSANSLLSRSTIETQYSNKSAPCRMTTTTAGAPPSEWQTPYFLTNRFTKDRTMNAKRVHFSSGILSSDKDLKGSGAMSRAAAPQPIPHAQARLVLTREVFGRSVSVPKTKPVKQLATGVFDTPTDAPPRVPSCPYPHGVVTTGAAFCSPQRVPVYPPAQPTRESALPISWRPTEEAQRVPAPHHVSDGYDMMDGNGFELNPYPSNRRDHGHYDVIKADAASQRNVAQMQSGYDPIIRTLASEGCIPCRQPGIVSATEADNPLLTHDGDAGSARARLALSALRRDRTVHVDRRDDRLAQSLYRNALRGNAKKTPEVQQLTVENLDILQHQANVTSSRRQQAERMLAYLDSLPPYFPHADTANGEDKEDEEKGSGRGATEPAQQTPSMARSFSNVTTRREYDLSRDLHEASFERRCGVVWRTDLAVPDHEEEGFTGIGGNNTIPNYRNDEKSRMEEKHRRRCSCDQGQGQSMEEKKQLPTSWAMEQTTMWR